jgi:small-conductance mechanosensitive channel
MNIFWEQTFLGNAVRDWAISFAIITGALIFLRLLQSLLIKRLTTYAIKTKTTIDDFIGNLLQASVMPLLYILAFYFGLSYLHLPDRVNNIFYVAITVAVTFFILRSATSFIGYLFKKTLAGTTGNEQREKQAKGILLIGQILVWLGGILFLIDNLGYDITTLIAGLGIGGIAIALAAQAILGDLFSYLVIFLDKPFEIGDFIIVEDKMGTVEYIGIKTTRLKTLSGEQLICSNSDLTNSRVHNYKRMQERRVVFNFGIVYDTPVQKIKLIPQMVKGIVESIKDVRFDRAHFKSFGNFSLDFEVVYFVLSPDYNFYMDKQQNINIRLFETFEKEGIGFAFPTQTVYLNNVATEKSYS